MGNAVIEYSAPDCECGKLMIRTWSLVTCADGTWRLCSDRGIALHWLATIDAGQTQSNYALHGGEAMIEEVTISRSKPEVFGWGGNPAPPSPPSPMPPLSADAVTHNRIYTGSAPPAV